MKKGLSILLIAAALFGFYGGAVNLNDVLACKGYWEEEGEKSTADMNKLEDGLNQLKDNEQAYLDGLDQVKDGEKELAKGEADYADGQATLAQGEADYAAAPGKLADARAQIAKGEKDLAAGEAKLEAGYDAYDKGKADLADGKKAVAAGAATLKSGYKSRSDLDKLIKGLKTAKNGYDQQWQPGFGKKATKADFSDAGLKQARGVITSTLNTDENKQSVGLIESLAGKKGLIKGVSSDKSYKDFDKGINNLVDAFGTAADKLDELKSTAESYAEDTDDTKALKAGLRNSTEVQVAEGVTKKISELNLEQTKNVLAGAEKQVEDGEKELSAAKEQLAAGKAQIAAATQAKTQLEQAKAAGATQSPAIEALGIPAGTPIDAAIAGLEKAISEGTPKIEAGQAQVDAGEKKLAAGKESVKNLKALVAGRETAQKTIAGVAQKAGDKLSMAAALDPRLAKLGDAMTALSGAQDIPNGTYADTYEQLQGGLKVLAGVLGDKIKDIKSNQKTFKAWDSGYNQLVSGQATLASTKSGLPFAFKSMAGNATIRKALKKNAPKLLAAITAYTGSKLANEDLGAFDKDMSNLSKNVIPGLLKVLQGVKASANKQLAAGEKALDAGKAAVADGEKALKSAAKQLAKGEKDLAAGRAKLADGKKQYAQGLADYEAAPAKLEEGRAQLAEGLKKLQDGRAALAAGKEKLAEYEDGEQQVRDGLATLMSTEPNGGLESILDRRNGDADFDNGDNHLELDEGLEAVTTGREYQAASGELITKEITNRAVGTAAGLGAGVLAVLAGILSLLKKNKGAGVSALLSAAAGGVGAGIGAGAGTEFSAIAGSAVGSLPYIAFGVLAAVALAHAIVHFTGNKAA